MNLIQHIQITCDIDDFSQKLNDAYGADFSVTEVKTRKGKELLKVDVKDRNEEGNLVESNFLVLTDSKTNKVTIELFELSSQASIPKLLEEMHSVFLDLSIENKGTYVAYNSQSGIACIVEGKRTSGKVSIVPLNFKTPFEKDKIASYDSGSGDLSYNFKINKTIKEYLTEEPEVGKEVSKLGHPENLNYLAKHLMQSKINEGISFEDFIDLFRQCALLGADDPTVIKFNQILKA